VAAPCGEPKPGVRPVQIEHHNFVGQVVRWGTACGRIVVERFGPPGLIRRVSHGWYAVILSDRGLCVTHSTPLAVAQTGESTLSQRQRTLPR
jgi:hypothetical protein